jgi:hypothetical protein
MDHAHDALMLALLAITENYGDLNNVSFATGTGSFSNNFYMPLNADESLEEDKETKKALVNRTASLGVRSSFKKRPGTSYKRNMF